MTGAEPNSPCPPLVAEAIHAALGAESPWPEPQVAPVVDSTNDRLAQAARAGAPAWSLLAAEAQTAGRGRRGRGWASPPAGNLYMSVLTPVIEEPAEAARAPLLAGVVAAGALEDQGGGAVGVKWPNDLIDREGGKLGGILVEGVPAPAGRRLVVGIGINVAAAPAPEPGHLPPASLQAWLGRCIDRNRLAGAIGGGLRDGWRELGEGGFPSLRRRWEARAMWLGRAVRVVTEQEALQGRAEGIDDWGRLRLVTEAGELRLTAGDLSLRPVEEDGG